MSARQRMLIVLILLYVMVMASALLLVYSRHQSRKLFVELQQLNHRIGALNTEWSQLQLEQSAWSRHGRIEGKARKELSMIMPRSDKVIYVRLQ